MVDFGVIDKLIAIVFSIAILLNGYFVGKLVKTYLFPACIFSFFWFIYTFFPLVLLFDVPINPLSVIFIFLCTLVFSIASLLFNWKKAFRKNKEKAMLPRNFFCNKFLKKGFNLVLITILVFIGIDLVIQGFDLSKISNRILESAGEYSKLRYAEELEKNIFAKLVVVLSYVLVVLGGVLAYSSSTKRKMYQYFLLSMLPSVLIMVLQSSKGLFQLSIIFYFSGVLLVKIFKNEYILLRFNDLKKMFLFSLLLLPVLIASFLSRGVYEESMSYQLLFLLNRFNSYLLAHLYAFSDWLTFYIDGFASQYYPNEENYNGFYTFMSLFRFFGDNRFVPQGTYAEYFSYQDAFRSNIYTIFRGTIVDFGILGTFIFLFILSFIIHNAYNNLLLNRRPIVSIAVFSMSIGFFQMSPLISFFMYNSFYVTLLLLIVMWWLNNIYTKNQDI